jgi:hypothetical protein
MGLISGGQRIVSGDTKWSTGEENRFFRWPEAMADMQIMRSMRWP